MNKRKSAGFTVDDALWRRFKSKAADDGLPIGEILVKLVRAYLDGDVTEVGKGSPRKEILERAPGSGRKGGGKKKAQTGGGKRTALERGSRESAAASASSDFTPGDEDDEGMAVTDRDLVEHASHFSIKVCGDEGALREKVLRAIEEEHGERGGDEEWIGANLGMRRWYNDNRG